MASATRLLVRDELIGFARSKVMIVLYIVMPALALAGFLLLRDKPIQGSTNQTMTATTFMTMIMSSIAGTAAALMCAVDVVSEKNRNVFVLLAIRPIRREAIVWAKFIAVTLCVSAACVVAFAVGIAADAIRGTPITGHVVSDALRALGSLTSGIAISSSVGLLFGTMSRSIVAAVVLVLYVGQNLAIVPMLPVYLGVLPDKSWIFDLISVGIVALMLWLAGLVFRRTQL
jgi:ABC-type transport system involved in multi-copper enzyme maturation permease subunit